MVSAHQNAQLDWQRTKETTTAKPGVWHRTVPWRQPNFEDDVPPSERGQRLPGLLVDVVPTPGAPRTGAHRPTRPRLAHKSTVGEPILTPDCKPIATVEREAAGFVPPASQGVLECKKPVAAPGAQPPRAIRQSSPFVDCPPLFFASHTIVITRDPRDLGGGRRATRPSAGIEMLTAACDTPCSGRTAPGEIWSPHRSLEATEALSHQDHPRHHRPPPPPQLWHRSVATASRRGHPATAPPLTPNEIFLGSPQTVVQAAPPLNTPRRRTARAERRRRGAGGATGTGQTFRRGTGRAVGGASTESRGKALLLLAPPPA